MTVERAEVVVVGGGPAGAAVGMDLARRGRHVVLLERRPSWAWHACGVFASPATIGELRRLGLTDADLRLVALPIPAMRVEAPGAPAFRLTYGADGPGSSRAAGFDRSTLDPLLLGLARTAGVDVRPGVAVRSVVDGRVLAASPAGELVLEAQVVLGADGIRSVVARSLGVARPAPLGPRVGLTYHVPAPEPAGADARMVVLGDGYCGLAPVPGGRMNVGIVLGGGWRGRLASEGADRACGSIVAAIDGAPAGERCDPIAGAFPVGHRVSRRAGDGWLLVGDAAGFLDPFTGEGLHRALVSARLAARAIDDRLAGRASDLSGYERAMRRRFAAKDIVSQLVQAFLARPGLFAYAARRLAARQRVRETMGLVIGDLVPASRGLDPRFLAALLRP